MLMALLITFTLYSPLMNPWARIWISLQTLQPLYVDSWASLHVNIIIDCIILKNALVKKYYIISPLSLLYQWTPRYIYTDHNNSSLAPPGQVTWSCGCVLIQLSPCSTGWPDIHVRLFMVPCKKRLVQCTLLYTRTLDKALLTRSQKHAECITGHPVLRKI